MTIANVKKRKVCKLYLADEGCCVRYGEPLSKWVEQNQDRLIERSIYHDGVKQEKKAKLYRLPAGLIDLEGEWWMHAVTGTLYSPSTGACLSSHRLRVSVR